MSEARDARAVAKRDPHAARDVDGEPVRAAARHGGEHAPVGAVGVVGEHLAGGVVAEVDDVALGREAEAVGPQDVGQQRRGVAAAGRDAPHLARRGRLADHRVEAQRAREDGAVVVGDEVVEARDALGRREHDALAV